MRCSTVPVVAVVVVVGVLSVVRVVAVVAVVAVVVLIGSLSKSLRLALIRLPEVNFPKNETLRMYVGCIQQKKQNKCSLLFI